ncbi:MAG: hypothetical protein LDLANPLL_02899 [Turneriella sp.]|nr:hypothetical protein [Turneriella sp.]
MSWHIPVFATLVLVTPAVVIYAIKKNKILDQIGAVILCYIAGAIFGNAGVTSTDTKVLQEMTTNVSVALALPLLLFSMDIPTAFKNAGKAFLAMFLAAVAITAVAVLTFFLIKNHTEYGRYLASMAVAVYTGGTPNLAAVKAALQIPQEVYIKFHTYDALVGLFYMLFVFSLAQKFFSLLLKRDAPTDSTAAETQDSVGIENYSSLLKITAWPKLLIPLLLAFFIVGFGALLGEWVQKGGSTAVTMLTITTLGIAGSFIKPLRQIREAFSLGMYIILIFCVAVASLTDIKKLVNIDFIIMLFLVVAVFGSMAFHALLCRIFKIDTDTFIVVSVSAICSPPFVPPAASAIKRTDLIPIGLTTGLIGYGIGNYLGIGLYYLLG